MTKIFYIMGPSGCGKDTIINALRARSIEHLQVAHRYITRDWQAGGENHIQLTLAEFNRRKALGLFALNWSANQHHYAIGKEIDHWLACGENVLINGSRSYLSTAITLYPDIIKPVLIDVNTQILAQRLNERGRESQSEIKMRIERHKELRNTIDSRCEIVVNNSTLDEAVEQLSGIILNSTAQSQH